MDEPEEKDELEDDAVLDDDETLDEDLILPKGKKGKIPHDDLLEDENVDSLDAAIDAELGEEDEPYDDVDQW